jgi:formylglycine-generating enzyme required for sulfatase activity
MNELAHEVQITKAFYMSTTEVTEAQWLGVIGEVHLPDSKPQSNHPVYNVNWDEAIKFCRTLSSQTGLHVQLPSEAQWEYACRAGNAAAFCPTAYNRFTDGVRAVAGKGPNSFGLYDMHGNVYELCRDYFDEKFYSRSGGADPENTEKPDGPNSRRVMRGGSWASDARLRRSAARWVFHGGKTRDAGLRIIFSLPDKTKVSPRILKAIAVKR